MVTLKGNFVLLNERNYLSTVPSNKYIDRPIQQIYRPSHRSKKKLRKLWIQEHIQNIQILNVSPAPPPSFISSFQHIPLIRKNYILRLNVFKNNTWLEILHCLRSYFVNWLWWELEITTFLKDTFIFKRKKKGYNHFTVF